MTNLDLSKASRPDCIPVLVLKSSEPELSYILAELFNICLREFSFPDCWKVSSVVPVFKNIRERCTTIKCHPVILYSVVSKVFEKHVNNRLVNQLEKCGLFSDRAFIRSGSTQAVAPDISMAFDSVCNLGLLYKLMSYDMSYGISGQMFGLILSFLNNK